MTDREIVVALAGVIGYPIRSNYDSLFEGEPQPYPLFHDCGNCLMLHVASNVTPVRWNPLESIADAWMVVEALLDRGYSLDITGVVIYGKRTFGCALGLSPKQAADSVPRAICLAALRAMGVEA